MNTDKTASTHNEKLFIGVSWPYASNDIHIGHLAGQYVVCDVFARYHRLRGHDVLMVSGSDSHGTPIVFKAEKQGITPKQLATQSHKEMVQTYKDLGFAYENYTSTMTDTHKEVVHKLFNAMRESGYLQAKKSKQFYDVQEQKFLPDRYVRGTCPHCGATNARGDECPECGAYLEPTDLIDPRSTVSESKPEIRETEHFYMDLSALQSKIGSWLEKESSHWREWVREFSLGWIRQGLKPRPITRDMKWGIPVPVDGWDDKVIYVWFEAVIGYLSAAIEWSETLQKDDPSAPGWESFWKDDNTKHYYFIAGGNVPFHTIIWPGEILAFNQKYQDEKLHKKYLLPGEKEKKELNLPYDVPANNMLTLNGKKMSKSDGNAIPVNQMLEMFGADLLRYFLTRYAPEKTNRDFSYEEMIQVNNAELVGNIGNFINRALTFTRSKFDNKVPNGKLDPEVENKISEAFEKTGYHLENTEFSKALSEVVALSSYANKYFNDKAPWVSIKENKPEAENTIYNVIRIVAALQKLLQPFLPHASKRIASALNIPYEDPSDDILKNTGTPTRVKDNDGVDRWICTPIEPGHQLGESQLLFEKREYTPNLQAYDKGTESLDPAILYKDVRLAGIKKKTEHPHNANYAVYTVDTADDEVTVVSTDKTLQPGEFIFYVPPGGTIPHDLAKSSDAASVAVKTLDGVKSVGVILSLKELNLTKEHTKVAVFRNTQNRPAGARIPEGISTAELFDETFFVRQTCCEDQIFISSKVYTDIHLRKFNTEQKKKFTKAVEDLLSQLQSNEDISSTMRDYETLNREYGVSPDEVVDSVTALIKYLQETKSLPKGLPIVDLYNYVSALTGISIGIHDIDKIDGYPRLTILEKDTHFNDISTGADTIARKGEYAYVDDTGILCRLNVKQSKRTMITSKTKKYLAIFMGTEQNKDKLRVAEDLLSKLIVEYGR